MDAQRALADGEMFVKNATEELDRKILREDQLYFIDNQVEALDTFLADTEDLAESSDEIRELRETLRGLKQQLEKKGMEFMASQEGNDELPEDVPPEEMAEFLVNSGAEILTMADEALKLDVKKVDQVTEWEDPLVIINGFIADSETYAKANPQLAKVRDDVKARKRELQKRISDVVAAWRQADLAGGDE